MGKSNSKRSDIVQSVHDAAQDFSLPNHFVTAKAVKALVKAVEKSDAQEPKAEAQQILRKAAAFARVKKKGSAREFKIGKEAIEKSVSRTS